MKNSNFAAASLRTLLSRLSLINRATRKEDVQAKEKIAGGANASAFDLALHIEDRVWEELWEGRLQLGGRSHTRWVTFVLVLKHGVCWSRARYAHQLHVARLLFPQHYWVLVDPAPFDARDTDRIQVRQCFFTRMRWLKSLLDEVCCSFATLA